MADFKLKLDHRRVEFGIETDEKVTSYRGTEFVPNHCDSVIEHGKVVTLNLSKLDENGFYIDDPAGPYGAELHASFSPMADDLPSIAVAALNEISLAIR